MRLNNEYSGEDDNQGEGGVDGKVHFRYKDAASLDPRDDQLPPHELRRLLVIHSELHKARVDKQKATRNERKALKENRAHANPSYQQGGLQGGFQGGSNQYKKHPLTDRAQFSGIDSQVNTLPTELVSENNLELQMKLEKRFEHRNVPTFNPQPKPSGY